MLQSETGGAQGQTYFLFQDPFAKVRGLWSCSGRCPRDTIKFANVFAKIKYIGLQHRWAELLVTDTADPNGKDPQISGGIKVLMVPRPLWESHSTGGVARCRTLQVGLRWALSTGDAPAISWFVGLVGDRHTWVGSVSLGTLRRHHTVGVRHAGWFRVGCRRSGRHCDTIRLGRCVWWQVGRNTLVGLLHCWDAPAMPWSWEGK